MKWYALDVTFELAAREAVEYALMEAGASGTEESAGASGLGTGAGGDGSSLVKISAYFDAPPERERVRAALLEALRVYELPSSAVRDMQTREVAEADWLAEWKKGWQPVEVGRRFLVAPPWYELNGASERIVIRIEPGMAFGTGTHETTRLCLAVIEEHFHGGSFLDVGTGTGILAIAAAKLFPEALIEACDTDAHAVTIAHQNALLNGVAECISFRTGTVDDATASADIVCANLTVDVILPLLPALVAVSCERLILSGILQTQVPDVATRLHDLGIDNGEIFFAGEWVAMSFLT